MKRMLLITLGLVLTYGLDAQLRYGIKLGGTLSSIYEKYTGEGGGSENSDPKLGIKAGAILEYSFSPSFALQPELLYVNSGGKYKFDEGTESLKMNLHQLQLPVNVKYKMGTDNLKFYVAAGPYIGYIFAAREKWSDEDESESLYGEGSRLKHIDFGVGAGLGIEISNKYIVGAGYKYGMSNLTKAENAKVKTGTFDLSIGYFF
jgi:opacity protein-like surface antigen